MVLGKSLHPMFSFIFDVKIAFCHFFKLAYYVIVVLHLTVGKTNPNRPLMMTKFLLSGDYA